MSATPAAPSRQEIRDYLLRRLPEAARARFEEAYFRDDSLLDRIEAEEDELVSDYVLGRLTETDRRRFEASLLGTPYYRERVHTTSQLRLRLSEHKGFRTRREATTAGVPAEEHLFPGRSGSAVAFALLAVLLLAAIASTLHFKTQLERVSQQPRPTPPPPVQTILLSPDGEVGPVMRRLAHEPGAVVQLVIPRRVVPAGAQQWRLALLDRRGRVSWDSGVQSVAPPTGGDLVILLPQDVPAPGVSGVVLETIPPAAAGPIPLGLVDVGEAVQAPKSP